MQVKDLAEAVASIVPNVDVSVNTEAAPDKRSYRVDFSLFKRLAPDHQPQIGLNEAVEGLRDGLQAMQFNDHNFRESEKMRLKVLARLSESGALDAELRWRALAA